MIVVLVRPPCVMEDEGHTRLIGVYSSWNTAFRALKAFTDEDTGYFKYANVRYMVSGKASDRKPRWWPSDCRGA